MLPIARRMDIVARALPKEASLPQRVGRGHVSCPIPDHFGMLLHLAETARRIRVVDFRNLQRDQHDLFCSKVKNSGDASADATRFKRSRISFPFLSDSGEFHLRYQCIIS